MRMLFPAQGHERMYSPSPQRILPAPAAMGKQHRHQRAQARSKTAFRSRIPMPSESHRAESGPRQTRSGFVRRFRFCMARVTVFA